MARPGPSALGWSAIAGVVVGYDVWALATGRETLSGGFARGATSSRVGRVAIHGTWLGLSWHLMRAGHPVLPPRLHSAYRRVHPLWRLHDLVMTRANARVVEVCAIPVPGFGTALQSPLAGNFLNSSGP